MELRKAEAVGAFDHHHRRVRDIDADFDDGGRNEDVGFAVAEAAHHFVLLLRRHAPVQQLEPQVRVHLPLQPLVLGRRRLHVERLRLLDERADDERLPPLLDLAAQETLRVAAFVRAHPRRPDRLASRRQLVHHRDVEVAVERQRQRARDRRRGHHQHVRRVRRLRALLAERRALHDAEAVLLVDDGDAEVVEAHAALDERVRAADHVDLAGLDRFVQLALLLRLQAAGEHRDSHRFVDEMRARARHRTAAAIRPEQRLQRAEVLLGQDLRRCHHHALAAVLDCGGQGGGGDHGLAAADVALDQARHGDRLAEVVEDVEHHALLRAGQRERQRLDERALDGRGHRCGLGGRGLLEVAAAELHGELDRQQLFEREASPRTLERCAVRRVMHLRDRFGDRREAEALAHLRGQRVGQARRVSLDRLLHDTADGAALQARGERVDRHETARVQEVLAPDLPLRIVELRPALVLRHAARQHDLGVDGELLRDPRLVEPCARHHAGRVADLRLGRADAEPHLLLGRAPDAHAHRLLAPELELRDGHRLAVIDVATREEEQQIADGDDFELLELHLEREADALQRLQLCIDAERVELLLRVGPRVRRGKARLLRRGRRPRATDGLMLPVARAFSPRRRRRRGEGDRGRWISVARAFSPRLCRRMRGCATSRLPLPATRPQRPQHSLQPLFPSRGRQRAVARHRQALDVGEDVAAELRALVRGEVLEEGIESGRDGAVAEALRALQLEDFPKAVFGHGDRDQGRGRFPYGRRYDSALRSRSSVRDQRRVAADRRQGWLSSRYSRTDWSPPPPSREGHSCHPIRIERSSRYCRALCS